MTQVKIIKISVDDKGQQNAEEDEVPLALEGMQIMENIPDRAFN